MLTEQEIQEFENKIGYTFKNKDLLIQAFTHSSQVNEQKINKKPDYERLEFLGDAVLEMISSAYLFKTYPEKKEGEMSKIRASLVCEPALAYCSEQIELKKYIQLLFCHRAASVLYDMADRQVSDRAGAETHRPHQCAGA